MEPICACASRGSFDPVTCSGSAISCFASRCRRVRVIIEHTAGARAGQKQEFEDPTVLRFGRHPSNHVQFDALKDLDASARHAELRHDGRGFRLYDVGSSNGTLIGGERVTERLLAGGEEVQFGTGGPRVRVSFDGIEPAAHAVRGKAGEPAPPAGVRATLFRAAVDAAVHRAMRPLRMAAVGLVMCVLLAGAGLLVYRARSDAREDALKRKMIELMERQRSAGDTERAELAKLIEANNAELRKAGSGAAISRSAR